MLPALDIFRVESNGRLLWRAAAADMDAANRRVRILMASEPSDYIIYSQETGSKTVISADQPQAKPSTSPH
jgi:hypothetical protein